MQTRIAVLADYANVAEGGKLNVMGIFTTLFCSGKAPIVHPQLMVVAQFEFEPEETGEKTVKTVLVDADGREIFGVSGQVVIPHNPAGNPTLFNQIMVLNNLALPAVGDYEFQILFDDQFTIAIPLLVAQVNSSGQMR